MELFVEVIPVGGNFIWYIFLAVLVFFAIYSLVLVYHWFRYSMSAPATVVAMLLYFSVSIVLLSVMFVSAANIIVS